MKHRHVYSPPKGKRYSRIGIAIIGGIFSACFVFYFIPLLKRIEASVRPQVEQSEAVEILTPPPPEFVEQVEDVPEEEPEEAPEMEEPSADLEMSLDFDLGGAGTGGMVIEIAPEFQIKGDGISMGDDLDTPPRPKTRFAPRYPDKLKKKKVQGQVLVNATISDTGVVLETSIKESSGHKEFDDAAQKALKKWKFKPGRKANKPVKARIVQPISFKLNNA